MPITRISAVMLAGLLAAAPLVAQSDSISAPRLSKQLADDQAPLVLDVRSPGEYQSGHVPGAVNIPYRTLPARLSEVSAGKQDRIVVYCEQGPRAEVAADILEDAGYRRVSALKGHMANWRAAGYRLE